MNQNQEMPSTGTASAERFRITRAPTTISWKGFQWKASVAPAAGTCFICRLAREPTTAIPSSSPPIRPGRSCHLSYKKVPKLVPITMATKVVNSSRPLARESLASGIISGRIPYFCGAEEIGLRRKQKEHEQKQIDPAADQRRDPQQHRHDFSGFRDP